MENDGGEEEEENLKAVNTVTLRDIFDSFAKQLCYEREREREHQRGPAEGSLEVCA